MMIYDSLDKLNAVTGAEERKLHSANHEDIVSGLTTDIYFVRTMEILRKLGKDDTPVVAEIFGRRNGILAGTVEALHILEDKNVTVYALEEGEAIHPKEVIMRIEGPYKEFGLFETALLGMLASASGWATAARAAKEACGDLPMACFGARHLHPSVAPVMERAALIGGADAASCILGAKLMGQDPSGTAPHSLYIILGDTVEGAVAYHRYMPADAARIVLVDTFKDEWEETQRVAAALKDDLAGIRLDTPSERGGVSSEFVREIRARLDQSGLEHVQIFISGGLHPERILALKEAGASAFGVGSYISGAPAIDMTMDLKEVNGKPIAKRGRIPGITENPRLKRMR